VLISRAQDDATSYTLSLENGSLHFGVSEDGSSVTNYELISASRLGSLEYRRSVFIDNPMTTALTNYPVALTFDYDARMREDFDDIHFVDEQGQPVAHFLDSVEVNVARSSEGGSVLTDKRQGAFEITESINGSITGSGDGWAYSASVPASGVYLFAATSRITRITVISGIDRSDHNPNDYLLYYTTDSTPSLNGNWLPLSDLTFLNTVSGGGINGNHLTMTGQDRVEIGFNPVWATPLSMSMRSSAPSKVVIS